jgi:hypothetical protein
MGPGGGSVPTTRVNGADRATSVRAQLVYGVIVLSPEDTTSAPGWPPALACLPQPESQTMPIARAMAGARFHIETETQGRASLPSPVDEARKRQRA